MSDEIFVSLECDRCCRRIRVKDHWYLMQCGKEAVHICHRCKEPAFKKLSQEGMVHIICFTRLHNEERLKHLDDYEGQENPPEQQAVSLEQYVTSKLRDAQATLDQEKTLDPGCQAVKPGQEDTNAK